MSGAEAAAVAAGSVLDLARISDDPPNCVPRIYKILVR